MKKVEYKYKSISIKELIENIDNSVYTWESIIQRDFIWRPKQENILISSVWENIPLPTIYLWNKGEDSYTIIDGQQRAAALNNYLKGNFKFKNMDDKPNPNLEILKYKFNELDPIEQNKFENERYVNICEITPIAHSSKERKYDIATIFKRLNTGGTQLSKPEIRNAIYNSKMTVDTGEMFNENAGKDLKNYIVGAGKIFSNYTHKRMQTQEFLSFIIRMYQNKLNGLTGIDLINDDSTSVIDTFYLEISEEPSKYIFNSRRGDFKNFEKILTKFAKEFNSAITPDNYSKKHIHFYVLFAMYISNIKISYNKTHDENVQELNSIYRVIKNKEDSSVGGWGRTPRTKTIRENLYNTINGQT